MRKYFNHIIIMLLLVISASSCKKWLDVVPGNQVREEDQFNSEAGFKDALMGVYLTMTEKSTYGKHGSWGSLDLMGQPYIRVATTSDFFEMQGYLYRSTGGAPIVEGLWKGNYNSIANVNAILGNLEKKKNILHPVSYAIIKGELLGLRAFLHFELMRIFGRSNFSGHPELASKPAIPYVTTFSKEVTPQRTYAATFQLMEQDIAEALELLKEDPVYANPGRPANYYDEVNRTGFLDGREFRMNYYAVKAVQARVFQWQGSVSKLDEAAKAAKEVIDHSQARLIDAAAPVKDIIMKSEHLFSLNIERFYDIINEFLSPLYITSSVQMYEADINNIYEDNTSAGLSDFRKQNWFNVLGNAEHTAIPKKMLQNINDGANRNRMPLIRLSEMYYIAAEGFVVSNAPLAVDYLNTVRRSRGIIDDIPSNANQSTIEAEITKEYRKDFIQEGQLFFYYKRKGFTSFPGLPSGTTAGDNIYMLPFPDSETESGTREQ